MAAEVANNQAVPAEENAATEKKVEEVEAASKEQGAIPFTVFFPSSSFSPISLAFFSVPSVSPPPFACRARSTLAWCQCYICTLDICALRIINYFCLLMHTPGRKTQNRTWLDIGLVKLEGRVNQIRFLAGNVLARKWITNVSAPKKKKKCEKPIDYPRTHRHTRTRTTFGMCYLHVENGIYMLRS